MNEAKTKTEYEREKENKRRVKLGKKNTLLIKNNKISAFFYLGT